jgi:hypothetical protein
LCVRAEVKEEVKRKRGEIVVVLFLSIGILSGRNCEELEGLLVI